jgi:hypothetical protein
MTLIDSSFSSSHQLNLINNGKLVAENWLVKTTSVANITVFNSENATLSFETSFIEDVTSETLTAVGPAGQQFVESSGGTIKVTNNGSVTEANTGTSDLEILLYIVIIVVSVAVSLFIIVNTRKKQRQNK